MALITGIHHITAMAASAQANVDFYAGVLGLRLVKKTVNFDAPEVYHFYYGDREGSPGSILTFFPFPRMKRGTQGRGQLSSFRFQIAPGSLDFWRAHLSESAVEWSDEPDVFGESRIRLADPDGMRLELIESPGPRAVGGDREILTIHSAVIPVDDPRPTQTLLEQSMNFAFQAEEGGFRRFAAPDGSILDLELDPDGPKGVPGAGTVHHIAFRTPDGSTQAELRNLLYSAGYTNISPVRDRQYFTSIYYREPGGVLFEAATDPPGFAVDEPVNSLGTELKLPPWLEASRGAIEEALEPISMPEADS